MILLVSLAPVGFARRYGSPGYSTLLLHSIWTTFFDQCVIKLPTGEYVSPQYGWSRTLESSSLVHCPTTVIASKRTIRDGTSYASCLTPIREEWLVGRDWYVIAHWEDQSCRDVYHDLCKSVEMQHLRASATVSPGTTPQVCPVDSIVNTHPVREALSEVTLEVLENCVWRYVLSQDDLATFRLSARSDVIGIWQVEATTYAHYYCQVRITITGCGFKSAISKSRETHLGLQANEGSSIINRTISTELHNAVAKRLSIS